jgi:biopolymer transport protein ExbD
MAASGLPDTEERDDGTGASIFAEINITPLTDIFLVLLIIFMVTTTAIAEAGGQNGGIKVTLPKGGKPQVATDVHDLAIAVLADGKLVVQGKVVDEATLADVLQKAHARDPETLVLVQADEGVIHGKVVAVMDLARRQGLPRLAIATRAER